ncbi:MAG TPA: FHA domain-containing protein [Kofleriaceae bacterium]|nr:FHA domain-containing protein [Kofleriaceae bacterium]
MSLPTSTDLGAKAGWRIEDPVIRLREWGTDRIHRLPDTPVEWTLGSAAACQLRLRDRSAQISRKHATLLPFAGGWKLLDQDSKNGLWGDGVRRPELTLTPGVEIGIGGLCLIAESRQLIALRALLCRFLGFDPDRQVSVDQALRSLREWAALRVSLVLLGDGDLTTVAQQLHAATLAEGAPFTTCSKQDSGLATLQATRHGTLWTPRLPQDFAAVAASLCESDNRTRLMLHAQSAADAARAAITLARPAIIALPSFTARHAELERILQESADAAAAKLGPRARSITPRDLEQLVCLKYRGFAALEATVHRVVVLRTWGVSRGADRLRISHVALSRWARRRNLTT